MIAQYGTHFAKEEILDRRFHRLLRRAFALRQSADYSTEPVPDSETVRELIEEGSAFLGEARRYVRES